MNEETILIMGDDLAIEEQANPTSPENTSPDDQSWLGNRQHALAGNFLAKHQAEFEDFQRLEREKSACAEQFRALESGLARRRQWLESLQSDIAEYQTIDLASDIFKNMELTGRPLLEIAQNPLFSGAALIQQHGKRILQLAENHVAGLQNKFDAFKIRKGRNAERIKIDLIRKNYLLSNVRFK